MALNMRAAPIESGRHRRLRVRSTLGAVCLGIAAPSAAFASVSHPPTYGPGEQRVCGTNRNAAYYSNDFEHGAGRQWRPREVTSAPNGERFLGRFVNESVVLRLHDLPPHRAVELSADVLVIMSWDGSHPIDGPDVLAVAVTKGPTPRHRAWRAAATFSNDAAPFVAGYEQTFPHPFPGPVLHPGLTDSQSTSRLGYPDVSAYGGVGDATYRVRVVVPHHHRHLAIRVTSRNAVDAGVDPIETDESFGLDDVTVRLLGRRCR
jgi:hypothetical protein